MDTSRVHASGAIWQAPTGGRFTGRPPPCRLDAAFHPASFSDFFGDRMERPASSTLPTTPGIYIYKDAQGRIIYVGKARNLRKRILSYFRDASADPENGRHDRARRLAGDAFHHHGKGRRCSSKPASSRNTARTTISSCATTSSMSCSASPRTPPIRALRSCVRPGATTPAISAPSPRGRRPRDMEDHPPGLPLTALRGPGLQKPRPALPLPSYRAVSRAVHGKRPR